MLHSGPNSKGWESPRFSSFPQIIVLQLKNFAVLKQIQFLSHQAKIASKIELFIHAPQEGKIPPVSELHNLKFKRIGYLSLDSNERSGFSARELKSVYIDIPACYLKISFEKCHVNKFNIFNQVGIIAINCMGVPVDNQETVEEPPPMGQLLEEANVYDAVTLNKLKMLNDAKEKAVAQEDFDEAKRIKDIMEKLKAVGKQLAILELKKKRAIENEDYESAKIIKIEIDRLRQAAFSDGEDADSINRSVTSKVKNRDYMPITQDLVLEEEKNTEQLPTGKEKVISGQRHSDKTAGHAEEIKGVDIENNNNPEEEPEEPPRGEPEDEAERSVGGSLPLPALRNKKNNPPAPEYGEEPKEEEAEQKPKDQNDKAEPLSGNAKSLAEPYFTLIEMELLEMLFSKNWGCRESGLDIINAELSSKNYSMITMNDDEKIMVTLLGLVSILVADKVAQVAQKAMAVIDTILKFYPHEIKSLTSAFNTNVDMCLFALLEKIGDNNPKVRMKAEESCLALAGHSSVGFNIVATVITKAPSIGAKKVGNSTKSMQGKINLLTEMIKQIGFESTSTNVKNVINYALAGVKNSSSDVRNASYALLVEIYKNIGESINPFIEELRPAQKELLQKEFNQVVGGDQKVKYDEPPEETITTNIAAQGGTKQNKKQMKKAKEEQEAEPDEQELPSKPQEQGDKVCEYCGKFDPKFNQDMLDMHMFNECPMLYLCTSCGNVIEIININNHLLKECTAKNQYRECPICHEAFHKDQLDEHVEEGACKPFNPEEVVRCPLCHMDIKPATIEKWREHILVKQCPNNERRPL